MLFRIAGVVEVVDFLARYAPRLELLHVVFFFFCKDTDDQCWLEIRVVLRLLKKKEGQAGSQQRS